MLYLSFSLSLSGHHKHRRPSRTFLTTLSDISSEEFSEEEEEEEDEARRRRKRKRRRSESSLESESSDEVFKQCTTTPVIVEYIWR